MYNWAGDISQMYRIQMDHLPFFHWPATAAGDCSIPLWHSRRLFILHVGDQVLAMAAALRRSSSTWRTSTPLATLVSNNTPLAAAGMHCPLSLIVLYSVGADRALQVDGPRLPGDALPHHHELHPLPHGVHLLGGERSSSTFNRMLLIVSDCALLLF